MPNITSVLRDEITKVSRKHIKADTEQLKKSSAKYRSEIAAMKRRITDLEQQMSRLLKTIERVQPKEQATPQAKHRFSSGQFKAYRERIGLSASVLGALLEVSQQTIYSWESGKTRPSDKQLEKIAALRSKGKRAIAMMLG